MAGNSWQQPVAGEPSLGTLHHLPLSNTTARNVVGAAVGAGWSAAIDCSGHVPAGAKAILAGLILDGTLSNAATPSDAQVGFSDNTSNTPTALTAHPHIGINTAAASAGNAPERAEEEVCIPLTSSRTFYYYRIVNTNFATMTLYVIVKGYYI